MIPEQQRIAIAEACEWTAIRMGSSCLIGDSDERQAWQIPDYLNDLNAMHEAEKVLTDVQYKKYCGLLDEVGYDDRGFGYPNWSRSATAAQRAEAFLRALKLWKE